MLKNILVTGGSGFIGSYVVDFLIKKKYRVTVLDLLKPKRKDVKFIKSSILNKKLIRSALKKNKLIFHLAAVSDINKVKDIPTETIETNILGTALLLDESRKANIKRFIFASTYYSYGSAGNLYTTSKNASESLIKNYSLIYGLKYTILRYPTAYGPRNRQVDAISIFVNRALKNLNLTNGLIFSQEVLLSLVQKGISREDAYQLVQKNAMQAWEQNKDFKTLLKSDKDILNLLTENEIESLFDLNKVLININKVFKRLNLS